MPNSNCMQKTIISSVSAAFFVIVGVALGSYFGNASPSDGYLYVSIETPTGYRAADPSGGSRLREAALSIFDLSAPSAYDRTIGTKTIQEERKRDDGL